MISIVKPPKFKDFPLHTFLLSVLPILSLFFVNIRQIDINVIFRPLIFSLLATIIVFFLFLIILKNWLKAGFLSSLLLVAFFSYGHVYDLLQNVSIGGFILGRHRFLLPICFLIIAIGVFLILRRKTLKSPLNQILNFATILFLASSIFQVSLFYIKDSIDQRAAFVATSSDSILHPTSTTKNLPDVYFIILDSYTRSDTLSTYYDFDNSSFVESLRNMGFFVADCSRSNYSETSSSLTGTLNLNYLPAINETESQGSSAPAQYSLVLHNLVRSQLEKIGYKTVAFQTNYAWTEMKDASTYFTLSGSELFLQALNPFEKILVDTTMLRLAREIGTATNLTSVSAINHPWADHIALVRFVLDELKVIPNITGPKFVFAHILVPHVPFVFGPNGDLRTDPGFFGGKSAMPINAKYLQDGYTGQVQFINSQMLPILQSILNKSKNPPIIIMMGDHGFSHESRNEILSTYYFPDHNYSSLYSTISPVNSFRVVFNQYFGTNFDLLPDKSFLSGQQTFESSPACINK
jgi:hypothetical protein